MTFEIFQVSKINQQNIKVEIKIQILKNICRYDHTVMNCRAGRIQGLARPITNGFIQSNRPKTMQIFSELR